MAKQRERILQEACIKWFRFQYPKFVRLLFAVPNGTKLPGTPKQRAIMGARLKREGLVPGVADLFFSVASGELHGLYIETKTPIGTQSDEQIAFEAEVIEQGYGYVITTSIDEFQQAIRRYLETGEY